jgi:hypothetical protein
MSTATKTRVTAGLAAVITGMLLDGATGLMFASGWTMSCVGLVALFTAASDEDPPRVQRISRRLWARRYAARSARMPSVVTSAQRA